MRRRTPLVVAVLIGVVGVAAAATLSRREPDASKVTPVAPGWSGAFEVNLSTSGLWFAAPIDDDRVVLVGGSVFRVHGPVEQVTELTVVSLGAGRSTRLVAPPARHPLAFVTGLTVGGRLLVLGKSCERFDEGRFQCIPGTYEMWDGGLDGDWRQLTVPDVAAGDLGADGFLLVGSPRPDVLTGRLDRRDGRHELWSYDLGRGAWTELPAPPVSARQACSARDQTTVLEYEDAHTGPVPAVDAASLPAPRLASYDHRTGQWATLSSPPLAPALVMRVVCAGSRILVTAEGDGRFRVATFDPTAATWTLSEAPVEAPFTTDDRTVAWNGSELIVWDPRTGVGTAYRPAHDAWRPVPGGPPSLATVALPNGHLVVVREPDRPDRRPEVHRYAPAPDDPSSEQPLASSRR